MTRENLIAQGKIIRASIFPTSTPPTIEAYNISNSVLFRFPDTTSATTALTHAKLHPIKWTDPTDTDNNEHILRIRRKRDPHTNKILKQLGLLWDSLSTAFDASETRCPKPTLRTDPGRLTLSIEHGIRVTTLFTIHPPTNDSDKISIASHVTDHRHLPE